MGVRGGPRPEGGATRGPGLGGGRPRWAAEAGGPGRWDGEPGGTKRTAQPRGRGAWQAAVGRVTEASRPAAMALGGPGGVGAPGRSPAADEPNSGGRREGEQREDRRTEALEHGLRAGPEAGA